MGELSAKREASDMKAVPTTGRAVRPSGARVGRKTERRAACLRAADPGWLVGKANNPHHGPVTGTMRKYESRHAGCRLFYIEARGIDTQGSQGAGISAEMPYR